jgi:hypothetical protein
MFAGKLVRRAAVARTAHSFSTVAASSSSGGSTLFQRLNSFMVGAGIGFGSCFYYVHEELRESNAKFEGYLDKLEGRIKALEK